MTHSSSVRHLGRAALLCLTAGYVDAFGYVRLDGFFACNQTGNTVLLAIAAVQGEWRRAGVYLAALGAFFAGALAVRLAWRLAALPAPSLLAVAALLVVAGFLPVTTAWLPALLAFAMGMQGASLSRFGAAGLQTVVV